MRFGASSGAPASATVDDAASASRNYYRRQEFRRPRSRHAQASRVDRAQGANPSATLLATSTLRDRDGIADARALASRPADRAPTDRAAPRGGRCARRAAARRERARDPARGASTSNASRRRFVTGVRSTRSRLIAANAGDARIRSRGAAALPPRSNASCSTRRRTSTNCDADLERTLVDEPPATLGDGGVVRPEPVPSWRNASRCAPTRARGSARARGAGAGADRDQGPQGQVREHVRLRDRGREENTPTCPADYVRKQTLTGAERYMTPELKRAGARDLNRAGTSRTGWRPSSSTRSSSGSLRQPTELSRRRLRDRPNRRTRLRWRNAPRSVDTCGLVRRRERRRDRRRAPSGDGELLRSSFVPNDLQLHALTTAFHLADRAEYGREVDVPAASRALDDHGADRLVRPREVRRSSGSSTASSRASARATTSPRGSRRSTSRWPRRRISCAAQHVALAF